MKGFYSLSLWFEHFITTQLKTHSFADFHVCFHFPVISRNMTGSLFSFDHFHDLAKNSAFSSCLLEIVTNIQDYLNSISRNFFVTVTLGLAGTNSKPLETS